MTEVLKVRTDPFMKSNSYLSPPTTKRATALRFGFTLIELLVVIAIIAILASL